jgi:uncharacterized spore protein YtfJ
MEVIMAEIIAKEILSSLLENLKEMTSSKTIIGDPIEVGKNTIVPVMKVSLGIGAGGGNIASTEKNDRTGGGGGGGLCITPVGFLVIQDEKVLMVTPKTSRMSWLTESLPEIFEKFAESRKKKSSKESDSDT